jgi:isopenicillin N synthase-like dioxygenase
MARGASGAQVHAPRLSGTRHRGRHSRTERIRRGARAARKCVRADLHPAPNQLIKIIRYPGRATENGDQGVGAHKDSGFVTILLQEKQAGLQVQGEGGWIDAPPIPGTFVVNIGEILEMASSGYLRANVHRVVSPPAGTDRLSVALFLGARLDATVPVLSLPPQLAAQARGLTQDARNPLFREVGRNYLKSRLRSHPDLARRHHPDLIDSTPATLEQASAY